MKSNKEPWLKSIRMQMQQHTNPVPADGWERIAQTLKQQAKPKVWFWMPKRTWVAVAALLLLLLTPASLLFFYQPTTVSVADADNDRATEDGTQDPLAVVESSKIESVGELPHTVAVAPAKLAKRSAYTQSGSSSGKLPLNPLVTDEAEPLESEAPQLPPVSTTVVAKEDSPTKKELPDRLEPQGEWIDMLEQSKKGSARSSEWQLSALAVAGTGSRNSPTPELLMSVESGYFEAPSFDDIQMEPTMNYSHHAPITVGVLIQRALSDAFAVETGLLYSNLTSDMHNSYGVQMRQQLHFLGVPVRLHYTVFESANFSIYAAAGGTVEKCIAGDVTAISGSLPSKYNRVERPFQLSTNGGVGIQYNFTRHLGIYAEPLLAYYFDNGSSLTTIRSERPLQFSVQFGLRLSY